MAASVYAQTPLIAPPGSAVNPGNVAPEKIPSVFVQLLFIVAAALAIIYLIIGGIRWITSRGDKSAVEGARKQIVAAIVGLVVVALAFLIMSTVFRILGVSNPVSNFTLPTL